MNTPNTSPQSCVPFERSASVYDLIHSQKNYARESDVLRHHLRLTPSKRVVEFGCGTGQFTCRIGEWCDSVVASDPSISMIAVARRKTWNRPEIAYAVSSIQDWPQNDMFAFHGQSHVGMCMFGALSYAAPTLAELKKCLGVARQSLYYDSRFVFDVVNYACCVGNLIHLRDMEFKLDGGGVLRTTTEKSFSPHTSMVDIAIRFTIDKNGSQSSWIEHHKMRAFTPSEIEYVARDSGFEVELQSPSPDRPDDFESAFISSYSDFYFWNVLVAR